MTDLTPDNLRTLSWTLRNCPQDDAPSAMLKAADAIDTLARRVLADEKLREAASAIVDFHNLPAEAKRSDVFQMRVMRLALALAAYEKGEG